MTKKITLIVTLSALALCIFVALWLFVENQKQQTLQQDTDNKQWKSMPCPSNVTKELVDSIRNSK